MLLSRTRVVWAILAGGLLAGAMYLAGLRLAQVTSGSMLPTIAPGDWVVWKVESQAALRAIARGDIVVFAFPPGSGDRAIKRAAGLEGDRQAVLAAPEGQANAMTWPPAPMQAKSGERRDLIVPPGTVFLLGDNVSSSLDSRYFGPVPLSQIVGRVLCHIPRRTSLIALLCVVLAGFAAMLRLHRTPGSRDRV